MSQLPKSNVSTRFCSPDSDITIRSCDGVVFKFYQKRLECYSEVFGDATAISSPEEPGTLTVDLTESSEVIDLLLQFMSLQPQPDLTSLEFPLVAGLAEASEKYRLFAAMTVCKTVMTNAIPSHPLEVLEYAAKHGYAEVIDAAAMRSIGIEMDTVAQNLSHRVLVAWLRYFQLWLDALCYAHNFANPMTYNNNGVIFSCMAWTHTVAKIGHRLGARLESLKDLDDTFRVDEDIGYLRATALAPWKDAVRRKMNSIPKFSTLL